MASQEWTEFVRSAVRASFWMRKFSSIVSRADARTPTDCGPYVSRARASPSAAVRSASTGCASVVFEPITSRKRAFSISGIELVEAPLPNDLTRP